MKKTFLTAVAVLFALSAMAGAITINNPGFEDPVLSDGAWTYDYIGWNTSADEWVGTWNPDPDGAIYYGYGGNAPEGQNVGWAAASDTDALGFGQILAETLTADTTYTLTVEVGNNFYYAWNGYQVQLLAGGNLLAEDDNTLTIASDTFETSTVTYTSGASVTPGQALEIRLLAKVGTGEANFDNVQLIPEPATMGLLGLGALALIRRKRK